MPAFLKRFFAWIGSLMRGRRLGQYTAIVTASPPPPASAALIFNLATNSQYLPVISF